MHRYFDAEDQPCRAADAFYTVVAREPEWDDASRARAMQFDEYESSIDPETGLTRAEAYTDQPFVVHSDIVNFAAKAIAKIRTADGETHKDTPGWFDGRRYIAQVHRPDPPD